MVTLTGRLTAGLALVDVEISIDQLAAQASGTVIGPRRCAAIIDPGTNITCVDPSILQAQGLTPFDRLDISLAQGDVAGDEFDLFKVWLTVKHPSGQPSDDLSKAILTIVQLALVHLGVEVLIGCDVLARCQFLYDGPGGAFTLTY